MKLLIFALFLTLTTAAAAAPANASLPNILWITTEDMSPDIGPYGDPIAHTPRLDALAKEGCVYTRAFASSPVCSSSRSAIITGMYATTLGTHHHRSKIDLPDHVRAFPAYLRQAGYYCTNNYKTDYNFAVPADAWDVNSRKAHWRNRQSPDQPFFSVFNFTTTHEGKFALTDEQFEGVIPDIPAAERTAPGDVKLPPYIPDTPVTRKDRARYYDTITQMDRQVGELLDQLKADGLSSNTIVMFYSDHGVGLPRGKRWLYDSGTRVPLIVRWPGQVKAGSKNDELVTLLDLPPTLLTLAGLTPPKEMVGRVVLGDKKQPEPQYLFQTRDRMDEVPDMIRSVRGRQFRYIKNFHPERPYSAPILYSDQTPTMKELRRLHARDKLSTAAALFFQPAKPPEELYDTKADPYEIHNLAEDPAHKDQLGKMRMALTQWQTRTHDLGDQPEDKISRKKKKSRKKAGKAQQRAGLVE